MERIKGEIISNEEKLHSEVHEITIRLNSIIQQNQKIVKNLKELNYKELLTNKTYYLNVMTQQHTTIQLLLLVNLQLEELQNSNKLTLKNGIIDDHALNKAPKPEETRPRKVSTKSKPPETVCNGSGQSHGNIADKNGTLPNLLASSDSSTLSTLEESTNTTSSDSIVDTMKSANENVKRIEYPLDPTVLAKLKQYDLLSQRQRYVNNLRMPAMPDLTFRKKPAEMVASRENAANRPRNLSIGKGGTHENRPRKGKAGLCEISEDSNGLGSRTTSSEKDDRLRQAPKVKSTDEVVQREAVEEAVKTDPGDEIFVGDLKPPLEPYVKLICLISHSNTPSEFYINYADDNIATIEGISADYEQHHDSPEDAFPTKEVAKEKLKEYCLCYVDSWQCWCRAKVVDWQDAEAATDDLSVTLVDYGCTVKSTYKNLRHLLKKYAELPQCAIKCHLAYLFPPDYTKDGGPMVVWPENSIETFRNIIGTDNDYTYEVVFAENINNSWAIDLVKSSPEEDNSSIGDQLLKANVCIEIFSTINDSNINNSFIKSQVETAQGVHGITPDMSDNDKIDTFYKNTNTKEPGNLDEALVSYKAKDEARTCQLFRRYGTCYKLPNCKFEHTHLRQDGFTTDKVEVHVETTHPLSLPTVGQTVNIRVTSISTLTSWYGHMITNISTYTQLVENLNNSKQVRNYKTLDILPSLAELVVVNTNQWCRGLVREVYQTQLCPEEMIQIFLVDSGETIEAKLSELRSIPHDLLYVPFQAVLLKLHGLKEKGTDEVDAVAYCEHNYVNQILAAKVLHTKSSVLVVTLTTLQQQHNVDVRTKIVQDGYGEITEEDLYPSTSYPLLFD